MAGRPRFPVDPAGFAPSARFLPRIPGCQRPGLQGKMPPPAQGITQGMNIQISLALAGTLALVACAKDQTVEFDTPPPKAMVVAQGPSPDPGSSKPQGVWSRIRTPDVTSQLYNEGRRSTPRTSSRSRKESATVSIRPPSPSDGSSDSSE